jgi:pilus assembly protein Flp/PilA
MVNRMANLFRRLRQDESGQDLVEYGLLLALVAVGTIASMQSIASAVSSAFAGAATNMTVS